MIHLITLNPAIDEYLNLDQFEVGSTNYVAAKHQVMGGKAVNVAKVLQNLKQSATLVTTVDYQNQFVSSSLEAYNAFLIEVDSIRTNLKINNNGIITEINERGEALSDIAKLKFENYIKKCVDPEDIVLIAGNPHADDEQFQYQLALLAKNNGARLFLDSNRFTFEMLREIEPEFIKPNDQELESLLAGGLELSQLTASVNKVIVSHGSKGFTYYDDKCSIHEEPIKGEPINSVGAGDSLVAGFIYAIVNNLPLADSLLVAKYCASATVYSGQIAPLKCVKQYDKSGIIPID
ncbi:PfkB family carbohydrate kinase [Mollicutes bacterium LVI A0039]|nr:PfkB family carbohydrate kinase [Mollicutes bacterium LVI A0039]